LASPNQESRVSSFARSAAFALLRFLWGAGAGKGELGQQMCRRLMVQCVAGAQAAKSPSPRFATKGFV